MGMAVKFPSVRTDRDISRLAAEVFALPGRLSESRKPRIVVALDEFQAIDGVQRRQRRARAAGRRAASARASAMSSPAPSPV